MNNKFTNIFKFITILIIIIIFIVFTMAFNQKQNIDIYAYVVALGIDSGDNNNLKVTFQFTKPSSSGESGSSETAPSYTYSVEAHSITSAINLINNYISRQANLTHCKIVAISEKLAIEGIGKEVNTLINDVELRPDTGIVITRCSSKYFLENADPNLENLISKYYEIIPTTTEITGYTSYIKIADFYNNLNSSFSEPCAMLRRS